VTFTKSLRLLGLTAPSALGAPTVEGVGEPAIRIDTNGIAVVVQGLNLRSNQDGPTVELRSVAELSLLGVDIQNTGSGDKVAGVHCEPGSANAFLIDQVTIHDTAGLGFNGIAKCQAIVANTLFLSNLQAVRLSGAEVSATILYSTFDDNAGGALGCESGAVGRLDSSILNNTNGAFPLLGGCALSFTDAFGLGLGGDNLDADPRFVGAGSFQLSAGSPCLGAANPVPAALPFPVGAELFTHDHAGAPRPSPAGGRADMGALERE
jgi:hypothetical protein